VIREMRELLLKLSKTEGGPVGCGDSSTARGDHDELGVGLVIPVIVGVIGLGSLS